MLLEKRGIFNLKRLAHIVLMLCTMALITGMFNSSVIAAENDDAFRATDLPLPRFVSLKSHKVFVRTGPGKKYPIKWVFQRKGLPVEIILEYETWRKIRDVDGEEGWVHQSLLSGRRTAIVNGNAPLHLKVKGRADSSVLAAFEPGFVLLVDECKPPFCKVEGANYTGWVEQSRLWGVYSGEEFE